MIQDTATINSFYQKVNVLFDEIKNKYSNTKKICVPVLNGFAFIEISNILRCESHINYTTIFMKDKQKLLVAKTLKDFEHQLTGFKFFRIHNSHLINLNYIKAYNKGKGGSVIMEDGSEIEVSTRRKDEFLKILLSA